MKILRDFEDNPLQIFNGSEPVSLIVSPEMCGLPASYQAINLVQFCTSETRAKYPDIPTRVMAYDTSIGRKNSYMAYIAEMPSKDRLNTALLVFTFFEVSAGHFLSYVHRIYRLEKTED